MKKNTAFPLISGTACILSVLLLAAAFVFPAEYLNRMADSLTAEGRLARDAILEGRKEAAAEYISNMQREFEKYRDIVKMFFYHGDVDELERALSSACDLAALEESDNLICELNSVLQLVEHMRSVENGEFSDIF